MIRIGLPIAQGAAPHGGMQLGDGKNTIAQAGCLLCCFTMAWRHVKGDPFLTVKAAVELIEQHGGFDGSKLRRNTAAQALGMHVNAWENGFDLRDVATIIAEEDPVVLGIDYRPGSSSAKSEADHFVLIVAVDEQERSITVANPATGRLETILVDKPLYQGKPCKLAETMGLCGKDH